MPNGKSAPEQQMPLKFDASGLGELHQGESSNVFSMQSARRKVPASSIGQGCKPLLSRSEEEILRDVLKRADRLSW